MTRLVLLSCLLLLTQFTFSQSPPDLPTKKEGADLQRSLKLDTVFRDYLVHLPAGYSPKKSYPLVFNLHGLGETMKRHMEYTRFNEVADQEKFIVVYPQGLEAEVPTIGTRTQWDAYFFTGTNDVAFIDTLIEVIGQEFPVDERRIYATGFSNGAFMTYRLACEMPGKLAAIAPVGGNMPLMQKSNCFNPNPIPILYIHGTDDKVVPLNGLPMFTMSAASTLEFFLLHNECAEKPYGYELPDLDEADGSRVETMAFADCKGKSTIVYYKVQDGGHTWPGATEVKQLGKTNQDFNASEVIWDFFSKYSLPKKKK